MKSNIERGERRRFCLALVLFASVTGSCASEPGQESPSGASAGSAGRPQAGTGGSAGAGTSVAGSFAGAPTFAGTPAAPGGAGAAEPAAGAGTAPVAGTSAGSSAAGSAGESTSGAGGAPTAAGAPGVSGAPASSGAASLGGTGGANAGGGGAAGDGKVVLFDGKNLDAWVSRTTGGPAPWRVVDGTIEVVTLTGDILTKQKFDDVFVHLEYWTPMYPSSVTGQARGNSGVYLKSAYELQVLDSFGVAPTNDNCGAIYGIAAPLLSACTGQMTWNTYEIEFKASRWNAQGVKTARAVMLSVKLNDKVVQSNVELSLDPTAAGIAEAPGPQPLMLQEHRNAVRFRNVWVIPR